jgi:hypothetical protein
VAGVRRFLKPVTQELGAERTAEGLAERKPDLEWRAAAAARLEVSQARLA